MMIKKHTLNFAIMLFIQIVFIIPNSSGIDDTKTIIAAIQAAIICAAVPVLTDFILFVSRARTF